MVRCVPITLLRGRCNPWKWIVIGNKEKYWQKNLFRCDISFWVSFLSGKTLQRQFMNCLVSMASLSQTTFFTAPAPLYTIYTLKYLCISEDFFFKDMVELTWLFFFLVKFQKTKCSNLSECPEWSVSTLKTPLEMKTYSFYLKAYIVSK